MVPQEVISIAEELALEYMGSSENYEDFMAVAWKIYQRLQAEEQALLQGIP